MCVCVWVCVCVVPVFTSLCVSLAAGPTGASDFPILHYGSQMRALLPELARTYVMQAGLDYARQRYARQYPSTDPDSDAVTGAEPPLVATICAMKAYVTWAAVEIANSCRERCGGQGYLSVNQLADAIGDAHANVTAEGDNIVLAQKACRDLVFGFGHAIKVGGLPKTFIATACVPRLLWGPFLRVVFL